MVSEPTMTHESEALALETMEERIRKDLEDDRKDTEYELSLNHYEAPIIPTFPN